MENKRNTELLKILAEGDNNEVPFAKTKTALLELGYTENEISNAVYQVSYDGKKNVGPADSKDSAVFKNNSKLTEDIAKSMLNDIKQRERDEAIAHGLASQYAPSIHTRAVYTHDFFYYLGLPLFWLIFIEIVLGIIIIKFNLPMVLTQVYSVVLGITVIIVFYRKYIKK